MRGIMTTGRRLEGTISRWVGEWVTRATKQRAAHLLTAMLAWTANWAAMLVPWLRILPARNWKQGNRECWVTQACDCCMLRYYCATQLTQLC